MRLLLLSLLGPGARFSKVPKLFGSISGATITFISSQRRGSKPSDFAILLVFLILKKCKKISFSKQADCSLTTSFSGPKSSRDFRETGPRQRSALHKDMAHFKRNDFFLREFCQWPFDHMANHFYVSSSSRLHPFTGSHIMWRNKGEWRRSGQRKILVVRPQTECDGFCILWHEDRR